MRRCFILGLGPSLRDQYPLLKRLTFRTAWVCEKAIYWHDMPFLPKVVITSEKKWVERIPEYDATIAERWPGATRIAIWTDPVTRPGWTWVPRAVEGYRMGQNGFKGWDDGPVTTGFTTVLTAAQLAARRGYTHIYLVGTELQGDSYVFGNDGWDLGGTLHAKRIQHIKESAIVAKRAMQEHGGDILDCSPNGLLNSILGYRDLEEAIA